MKRDRLLSSFAMILPDRDNIYELVVVAALRARQLNDFPHLRSRARPGPLVEQALREAAEEDLEYRIMDRGDDEEDGG